MTKRKSTPAEVSASTIRAAFRNGDIALPEGLTADAPSLGEHARGRLAPSLISTFLTANPGAVYKVAPKRKSAETVMLPRTGKNGRPLKPVEVPIGEARALADEVGKRGKMSSASLVTAGNAWQAAHSK